MLSLFAFSVGSTTKIYLKSKNLHYIKKTKPKNLRLLKPIFLNFPQPTEKRNLCFVDPDFKYQKFLNWWCHYRCFHAETFYKLPKDKQQEIINAYFGKNGLNYNFPENQYEFL